MVHYPNAGACMMRAVRSAMLGISKGHGGPFGACISDMKGNVIAVAHNTVWKDTNPTAHAEINAIRKACKKLGTIDLSKCVIYSTTEPCPMCLSAIHWSRIKRVVYGTGISDARKFGFNEISISNEHMNKQGHLGLRITKGFMREECYSLFVQWKKMKGKPY